MVKASNAQSCAWAAMARAVFFRVCMGPVRIQVVELQKGDVHVIIKISDQAARVCPWKCPILCGGMALPEGGGVPKKVQDEACSGDSPPAPCRSWPLVAKAWQYGWTTADNDHEDMYPLCPAQCAEQELESAAPCRGRGGPLLRLHVAQGAGRLRLWIASHKARESKALSLVT